MYSLFQITRDDGTRVWRAQKSTGTGKDRTYITGSGATKKQALERLEQNIVKRAVRGRTRGRKRTALVQAVWGYYNTIGTSPNNRYKLKGLIKNHIEELVQGLDLEDLTPAVARRLNTQLNNLPLGNTVRRTCFYILKRTAEMGVQDGAIAENPFNLLKPPPKRVEQNNSLLADRDNDYILLWRNIFSKAGVNQTYYDYIPVGVYWLLALLGLRQSERLGLTWDCISTTKEGQLRIIIKQQLYNDAEKGEIYIKRHTKTNAGERIIVLPKELTGLFLELKEQQAEYIKTHQNDWKPVQPNLVYTTHTGGFIRQAKDNALWREHVKKLGIQKLTGHATRHLFATKLAEIGIPTQTASALLGHNSTAMTAYYTHISTQQKTIAIEEFFTKIEKTPNQ